MAGTRNEVELAPSYRAATAVGVALSDVNAMNAISTDTLTDRATCYCVDTGAFYQYQQASAAAPDGVNVIAPLDGGPGNWIILSTSPGSPGGGIQFATRSDSGVADIVTAPAGTSAVATLNFTTTVANEKVGALFTADRFNADPAGAGLYEFLIDAAPVGFGKQPVGTVRGTMAMGDIFTVAAAGAHTLAVRVTASTGNETTVSRAVLEGVGYGAI